MHTIVIISEKENEKMMDIVEEMNALKVLIQTLAFDDEVYCENSKLYQRIKNDLKNIIVTYRIAWREIIEKYHLDPEKGDNYVLNFDNRSIHYREN